MSDFPYSQTLKRTSNDPVSAIIPRRQSESASYYPRYFPSYPVVPLTSIREDTLTIPISPNFRKRKFLDSKSLSAMKS